MIAFLTGRVAGKTANSCLLEVSGVGYRLAMSTSSLAALPAEGDEVTVWTYLYVREDELSLYGFESIPEKDAFERAAVRRVPTHRGGRPCGGEGGKTQQGQQRAKQTHRRHL